MTTKKHEDDTEAETEAKKAPAARKGKFVTPRDRAAGPEEQAKAESPEA